MLTETPQHKTVVDEIRCYDCTEMKIGRFTIIQLRNSERGFGPNIQGLYREYVCDPCFLRRRLEGKL